MTDIKRRLEILRVSLESGIIDKEQYDMEKEKLEAQIKEKESEIKDQAKAEENAAPEPQEPIKKSSERPLIIGIAIIIILFIGVVSYSFFQKEEPKTLEELHVLNFQGKLKPEQGYVYQGAYSFVHFDNVWYTQLQSPKGTRIYSMALRYSPKEVEDIVIEGLLDKQFFDSQSEFYVTFNPTGTEFSMIALAVADFDTHMTKVFEKIPVDACDRNETEICQSRPIVTCADTDKLVLYIRESGRFRTYYNNNCIVVEGNGFDLVRGVDRILYNLYGIMGQEEA